MLTSPTFSRHLSAHEPTHLTGTMTTPADSQARAAGHNDPFRLRDGRQVWFGPVTPAARDLIVRALPRLSPESSRRRFFTVRYQL